MQERRFVSHRRALSRAAWRSRAAARLRPGLLAAAFVPAGPVALGIDGMTRRRRGRRIAALWGGGAA